MKSKLFITITLIAMALNAKAFALNTTVIDQLQPVATKSYGIDPKQYNKAMGYLKKYSNQLKNTKYVTFVDFRRPSTQERMFVINLETKKISRFLVSHGMGSGELYANKFSNTDGSHMSSLGLYVIQGDYVGKHGKSLYLDGLEPSNSKARDRHIVMHAANYVSRATINELGYLGRSHGCPAMNPADFKLIADKLKNGSLLLIYK